MVVKDWVSKIIAVICLAIVIFTISPIIFMESHNQTITIVYNDHNGIIDSCGRFYSADIIGSESRARVNYAIKEMDTSVKPVTMTFNIYESNKNIPVISGFYSHFGVIKMRLVDNNQIYNINGATCNEN